MIRPKKHIRHKRYLMNSYHHVTCNPRLKMLLKWPPKTGPNVIFWPYAPPVTPKLDQMWYFGCRSPCKARVPLNTFMQHYYLETSKHPKDISTIIFRCFLVANKHLNSGSYSLGLKQVSVALQCIVDGKGTQPTPLVKCTLWQTELDHPSLTFCIRTSKRLQDTLDAKHATCFNARKER